jgi:hypothetical protein
MIVHSVFRVQLDSVRLGALGAPASEATHSALDSFEQSSSKHSWNSTGAVRIVSSAGSASAAESETALEFVVSQLRALLKEDKQRGLSDFDDHLDDVKADWTNAQYVKTVLPTMAAK